MPKNTKPPVDLDELEEELELDEELDNEDYQPTPKKKTRGSSVKASTKKPADDELEDEEDEDLPERDTYTAKQVATRIGTDAKTLRKFFRSSASTVEPVGQGGRYEFDAADMPKIKEEFTTWNTARPTRGRPTGSKTTKATRAEAAAAVVLDDELDLDEELEDDEPTADELEELELDDELEEEED